MRDARLADGRAPEFSFLFFSATPFPFFSASLRKQRRCRCYVDVKAILDFTIRVFLLLPSLFSLPPSPFSFLFFLRKQRRCRCYTDVKAILDFTIQVSRLLPPFSPIAYFFPILFGGNTTKKAPVSALRRCHGNFRFHINHFCGSDGQHHWCVHQ